MASHRAASNSESFDSEPEFIANTYLPLAVGESPPDAVQAVADCIQVYGWRVFQAIIAATFMSTRGRLLAVLARGLPQGLLEEFRGLVGSA